MRIKIFIIEYIVILFFIITNVYANNNFFFIKNEKNKSKLEICELYNKNYLYIQNIKTCINVSGSIQTDIKFGENVYMHQNKDNYYPNFFNPYINIKIKTISDTYFGDFKTFVEFYSKFDTGMNIDSYNLSSGIKKVYFEYGNISFGVDQSIFNKWMKYGDIISNDILNPMFADNTKFISYSFKKNNGIFGIFAIEKVKNNKNYLSTFRYDNFGKKKYFLAKNKKSELPNILFGISFPHKIGSLEYIFAYDSNNLSWAGKVKVNTIINKYLSLWTMIGYKNMQDYYLEDINNKDNFKANQSIAKKNIYRKSNSIYGDWGGHLGLWTGGTYHISPKTNFNFQIGYDSIKTLSSSINIVYSMRNNIKIIPELTYVSWKDDYNMKYLSKNNIQTSFYGKHAVQGSVRIQYLF